MGTYAVTPEGLYAAKLVEAYFPQSVWTTMVAVADIESVFNPSAINALSNATGLFQIEYWLHGITQQQALNPIINTQTAARMYAQSGLQPWAGDGYAAYLGIAQTLVNQTAPKPQASPILTISPTFGVSGSASVTSGGYILGTLRLVAVHGSVRYQVTMSVSPSYGSSYPLSTIASGTAPIGTTNVNQSLVAPLPSEEIIRTYQQQHSGPVTFAYSVNWAVADPATGQSKTVSGGQRVTLTVQ